MKKLLVITILSLLIPFLSYAKYPYGRGTHITFKDHRGRARGLKIRDKVASENFDFSKKKCPVPSKLIVRYTDIEAGMVDWKSAKNLCKSHTKEDATSAWRLPTQSELETIYLLEGTITLPKSKQKWKLDKAAEKYKYLKRDRYWVATVKDDQPVYLDFSQEEHEIGTFSQDSALYVRCVRDMVEVMAKFADGGLNHFHNWVGRQVKYPVDAMNRWITGRVLVKFVIDKDGSVVDIEAIEFAHDDLLKEVIRVLESSPKWTPGMQNGRIARVTYRLPVDFKIPPTHKYNPSNRTSIGSSVF